MMQKPAHPVGSLWSRGLLHIGTSSSTRATHTSPSRQSSQYLVALITFWLAATVSAPVGGEVLPGNDGSLFKRASMVNAPSTTVPVIDVNVVMLAVAVVRFDSFRIAGAIDSPEVTFCPVNLLVDDFRYCWMIWSFSGSKRKKEAWRDQSSRLKKLVTAFPRCRRRGLNVSKMHLRGWNVKNCAIFFFNYRYHLQKDKRSHWYVRREIPRSNICCIMFFTN